MASAMAVAVLGLRVPLQQRTAAPQMCAPGGRRVVVTGVGIVSCLGNSWDEVASSLFECKSGITNNPKLSEIGMKSHVNGLPDIVRQVAARTTSTPP